MKNCGLSLIILLIHSITIFPQIDYTQYVDPFIGTGGHGHTYPGASLPFGMIQLSPDTGTKGWDWSSGYHASDNSVIGFSHTHLSGTGVADYGDILFMPFTGEVKFYSGSKENPDEGYRSRFSKQSEKASPGYYSVALDDYNINVELTTTKRSGFHKYIFPEDENPKVIIDLSHGLEDAVLESYFNVIDKNKIEGYRTSSGWAKKHTVYFYAEFSKEIEDHLILLNENEIDEKFAKGTSVKACLKFNGSSEQELLVKIGISHVSLEGARKNLKSEINHWDFAKVHNEAKNTWNNILNRIEVDGGTDDQKITYYTALYHACLAPNLFSDVDNKYLGMDGKVKIADGFNMYTIFSLWDTFRALHPLLTIIDENLTNDLIKSILAKYNESGVLPVWELAANETWTMIGYHSIPVIVDAYMKGIGDFDVEAAYEAMVNSAMGEERGIGYYKTMGFIPTDKSHDAVSSTLEYAYDDWCIAVMAKELGKVKDYNYFMTRAKNYVNVFDPEIKFMRGKYNSGFWREKFDPIEPSYLGSGEFTEGNSWQYTWFVPQDVSGLINLMGGDKHFNEKLNALFTTATDKNKYKMPSDVTGLIGQYAHGNEPSHHISYLFNYSGHPWQTQFYTRKIMNEFFNSSNEGLCGNEDCGQMSAWYVLSAIGFYPVLPGSNEYAIGSTIFDKVIIHLENGNDFKIIANNNSDENKYIQSIKINNEDYLKTYFTHADIKNGKTIEYEMGKEPNTSFGIEKSHRPNSKIDKKFGPVVYEKNFMPIIEPYKTLFANSVTFSLNTFSTEADIRYTLDGSEPTEKSSKYEKPITQYDSFTLKAKVIGDKLLSSNTLEKTYTKTIVHDKENPFFKKDNTVYPTITKNDKYHENYIGGGKNGLIDGKIGSLDFRDSYWQGFSEDNCDIRIDFGKVVDIKKISVNFIENQGSWIFLPKEVNISFSEDGINYSELLLVCKNEVVVNSENEIKTFVKELEKTKARYLKFIAENVGRCPPFHKGAGAEAFMFIDEITIEE